MKINQFKDNMIFRSMDSLPFDITGYSVDHSIYGATSFVIEDDISVAYTGDIRLHGERGEKPLEFAKNARNSTILIT